MSEIFTVQQITKMTKKGAVGNIKEQLFEQFVRIPSAIAE